MASVQQQTQFSLFLMNKPGVLAGVLKELGRINLLAVTLVDSQEHGVLRVVAQDAEAARRVIGKLGMPVTETDVLCVELENHPGALAEIAAKLGDNHVNINYAYCTGNEGGERTIAVLKVADTAKAQRLLG